MPLDLQVITHLKGFTAQLNVWQLAHLRNKRYKQETGAQVNTNRLLLLVQLYIRCRSQNV